MVQPHNKGAPKGARPRRTYCHAFLTTAIHGFLPFTLTILVANLFSPEAFATYRYVVIFYGFLLILVSPGFQVASTKMAVVFSAKPQGGDAQPLTIIWLVSLGLALIGGLCILALPKTLMFPTGSLPLGLLAGLVLVAAAQAVPRGILAGFRRFDRMLVADVLGAVAGLGATLLAVQVGTAEAALAALITAYLVVLLVLTRAGLRQVPPSDLRHSLRHGAPAIQLRRVLSASLPLGMSGMALPGMMWGLSQIIAGP